MQHSPFLERIALAILIPMGLATCTPAGERITADLIPKPQAMEIAEGYLKIDSTSLFSSEISSRVSYKVDPQLKEIPEEGYTLSVTDDGVSLQAADEAGLFYGKQTLLQLLTPQGLPLVEISDAPRFPYRGLHLDVSRNFYPKEFVFKLIDAMAHYKLNTFHWHLTDGAGWRIEIDKYPKLTSEAAFRTHAKWTDWGMHGAKFASEGSDNAQGGYYSKEDVRQVIAYAASKHITVMPEIEMPGHSEAVLYAYPELSCSGKPYVNSDFCVGNDETFTFIENVLSEVIELFPSTYIHIGGDEASKHSWSSCPKCQARMKAEGLKDLDELQSYMIKRVEKFLVANGRRLIGWDEILEGGLAPEATVMSWRSEQGGIQSARMGHDVVMTPSSYMYLDYYQALPETQPLAIGGFVPAKRVYSYNPLVPDSLTEEEQKHILGVQANTWTEYMPTQEHLEYMIFPRALALAEVAWTNQELRTWDDFKPRLNAHIPRLQAMGINTFTLSDNVEAVMAVDTLAKVITVQLDAERFPAEIRYSRDGSMPTTDSPLYEEPIVVKDSAHIVAAIFRDGKPQGKPAEMKVDYHNGINKPIQYHSRLYGGYMAGGMNALLDGYRGGLTYLDGRWQGYTNSLDCTVDMGQVGKHHKVSARFMQLIGPQVYQPSEVELLTSTDGTNFQSQGVVKTSVDKKVQTLIFDEYTFRGEWDARYIRLKAKEDNGGYFIFVDEIVIW